MLMFWTLGAACAPRVSRIPASPVSIPTEVHAGAVESPAPTGTRQPTGIAPSPTPTQTPLPTASATPTVSITPMRACLSRGGTLEAHSLRDNRLKLPMEVNVYLPPCYIEDAPVRYPVLYLLHGQNFAEDQWVRLGAPATADRLIAAGEIPPFLMVMPRDRLWEDPQKSPFDEVFLEALLPWVDESFRTLAVREDRAVGGLSRGGAWAVHFGLSRPDLFGALGGHSAPVFWEDTYRVRGWLNALTPEDTPRIYLDIGEKDYLMNSNRWLVGVLEKKNVPYSWVLFPGYHEEAYWQTHLESYLRWYAEGWQTPP